MQPQRNQREAELANNPLAMTHTTRDGKIMLIGQMTDEHLVNQIKLLCGKIGQAKAAARGSAQFDRYAAKLYGITVVDADQAALVVGQLAGLMMPYIFEAMLRGLQEAVRPVLMDAIERGAALPGELPALPCPTVPFSEHELNDIPF